MVVSLSHVDCFNDDDICGTLDRFDYDRNGQISVMINVSNTIANNQFS